MAKTKVKKLEDLTKGQSVGTHRNTQMYVFEQQNGFVILVERMDPEILGTDIIERTYSKDARVKRNRVNGDVPNATPIPRGSKKHIAYDKFLTGVMN